MKKVPYEKLKNKDKGILNCFIFDKVSKQNALVVREDPLIIQLDKEEENLERRNLEDLEFYIYTKKEIDNAKNKANKLAKFLKQD